MLAEANQKIDAAIDARPNNEGRAKLPAIGIITGCKQVAATMGTGGGELLLHVHNSSDTKVLATPGNASASAGTIHDDAVAAVAGSTSAAAYVATDASGTASTTIVSGNAEVAVTTTME